MSNRFWEETDPKSVLFQAMGIASGSWGNLIGAGEFQSTFARDAGEEAWERICQLLGVENLQCECEAQTRGGFHQEPCSMPNPERLPHAGVYDVRP